MIKNIIIAVIVTGCMLWGLSAMMNSAIADVTGAGATTNTQSTTGSSATNTAITADIIVRLQQTISQDHHLLQLQITLQQTIIIVIQEILELYHQHQLQVYLQCHKIYVQLV
ncbi:MAG: hypothetical protein CM15mV126_310 [uncultured marine virus]|nr:MAG: hypothetical protein CM15mV126_310 [uncultured marine virus]